MAAAISATGSQWARSFSWSADGRYLEFQQWGGHSDETMQVRVLDTAASGTSLAATRVIVAFPYRAGTLVTANTFLTPDGTKVIAATSFYRPHHTSPGGYVQITGYSARTGKPLFHEDRFSSPIGWQNVLWSSADGSGLVISDPRGVKSQYGGRSNVLGILAGNKFTPIPHGADEFVNLVW
jgi:Tol biopolymer transport system component